MRFVPLQPPAYEDVLDMSRDEKAFAVSELDLLFSGRPRLYEVWRSSGSALLSSLDDDTAGPWAEAVRRLYMGNAGIELMATVWRLSLKISTVTSARNLLRLVQVTHGLTAETGASATRTMLEAVAQFLPYGKAADDEIACLAAIADIAPTAPEVVLLLAPRLQDLMTKLSPHGFSAWLDDGLKLYRNDRGRRKAYFSLDDPIARARLAHHCGEMDFSAHEPRLRLLAKALYGVNLNVATFEPLDRRSGRLRLQDAQILIPSTLQSIAGGDADGFYKAAVLHALGHYRFSGEKFSPAFLKPVQRALVTLLEDCRIERRATKEYPGLSLLWRRFQRAPGKQVRTASSLLARLSCALTDPAYVDDDDWVGKGRALFDSGFAETSGEQGFVLGLARILGNDLAQARIPFDASTYLVEPAYRDDGIWLFDDIERPEEADVQSTQGLPAAMPRKIESDDGRRTPSDAAGQRPVQDKTAGIILGIYPEWDYRLREENPAHVTILEASVPAFGKPWLSGRLAEHSGMAARIRNAMRRAKLAPLMRIKGQHDGYELDIDAVLDAVVSLKSAETPDPRIYTDLSSSVRDVSFSLLIDASHSTSDRIGEGGDTILQSAVLATALLSRSLDELGDCFAISTFSSDGRHDVRITNIKTFEEDSDKIEPRLDRLLPGKSTRLGAAIRHASVALLERKNFRRLLIVITDGEPSDIDIADPRYLPEDAQQAVATARRGGIDVFAIAIGQRSLKAAAGIFGVRNTLPVMDIKTLPHQLASLYLRLTSH